MGMTVSPSIPPLDPVDDLLVGVGEIGEVIRADKSRTYYLLKKRLIPAFKIGKLWYGRRSTLLRFLAEQEQAVADDAGGP